MQQIQKQAFWQVVADCLETFHRVPKRQATARCTATRKKIESDPRLPGESGEFVYHDDPFWVACQMTGELLDVAEYHESYKSILERHGMNPASPGESAAGSGRKRPRRSRERSAAKADIRRASTKAGSGAKNSPGPAKQRGGHVAKPRAPGANAASLGDPAVPTSVGLAQQVLDAIAKKAGGGEEPREVAKKAGGSSRA